MGAGAVRDEREFPERWRSEVFEMHMVIYALVEASTHNDALAGGEYLDRRDSASPANIQPIRIPDRIQPTVSGQRNIASDQTRDVVTRRGLLAAGVVGFGFSGLIDVLILHLILQWHHLLSGIYPMNTLSGLRTNILADGLFSIGMLIIMCVGAGLLWQAERRTDVPLAIRPLFGAQIIGLGIFDVYDAIVDHALLGLHQPIGQGGQPLSLGGQFNSHWLVVSLLFIAAGYYVYRTGTGEHTVKTEDI